MTIALKPQLALAGGSLAWWRAAAAIFLALKLVHLSASGVFMDEAYYWLWGQHPALSYFDHPPFNAWMQALSSQVFGWNLLALRFMVGLTLLGDMALVYLFSRRLGGADWERYFWQTLTLFLATPIFFTVSGLAIPDHWLTFFSLAALYGFVSFVEAWEQGKKRYRWLYLGALCLGLAALSKYNAALLGFGFALHILISRKLRPLLAGPHLYLAGLLSILIQAPVVIWNYQQGFSSFGFILSGRHAGLSEPFSLQGLTGFLLGALALLSPFLLLPIWRLLFHPAGDDPGRALARTLFVTSSLAILAASLFTDVLFHWNIVAYLAILPFLAPFFRPAWLRIGHLLYGLLFAALVIFNYAAVPVTSLVRFGDETSAWSYGWSQTAGAVERAKGEHGVELVASTDYTTASALAFALKNSEVLSLSNRRDQFDYWVRARALRGKDMILVADSYRPLPKNLQRKFTELVLLEELPVRRFGRRFNVHSIYLGRDYQP